MKNLDLKLYQILTGYYYITIKGKQYKIVYPSTEVKYRSEELYCSILEDAKYELSYISQTELNNILSTNKIWLPEMQKELDHSTKQLEEYKIKLYQNYFLELKKDIKLALSEIKKNISRLTVIKHSLDYLTLETYTISSKNQYAISQCIYDSEDNPVFDKDYNKLDLNILGKFLIEINYKQVTAQQIRDIVKSDTWKSYTCQANIFGPSVELNDDQRNLLSLEKMYQNAREHPDCPDDKIVNDDDALDGWFMFQRDKAKKQKKKNEALNKIGGNVDKHDNVYIMTSNVEEHNAVLDMNDNVGKTTLKNIQETADKLGPDGEILWQDIPAVRQDIMYNKDKTK